MRSLWVGRQRWLLLRAGVLTAVTGRHWYVSTGCLHGDHGYCAGRSGALGAKRPQKCKFCPARCMCSCHKGASMEDES